MSKSPVRGVPVELDKTRYLRFTLGAIREIKEDLGDAAFEGDLKPEQLGRFLWHGLKHEDEDLTVERVEDMVDLQNIQEVIAAVQKATVRGNGASPPTKAARAKPAASRKTKSTKKT